MTTPLWLRRIRRTPGEFAIALTAIAAATGPAVLLASLWAAVMDSSAPGANTARLLVFTSHVDGQSESLFFGYPDYQAIEDVLSSVATTAAHAVTTATVSSPHQRIAAAQVALTSPNYFDVVASDLAYGRPARAGEVDTVVLSARARRDLFPGTADVLGETVRIRGRVFTVIGVAAEDAGGVLVGQAPSAWVSLDAQSFLLPPPDPVARAAGTLDARRELGWTWLHVVASPRDGGDAAGAIRQQLRALPGNQDGGRIRALPWSEARVPRQFRAALFGLQSLLLALATLLGGVVFMQIVGSLLRRSALRATDFAIRLGCGATPRHVVAEITTDAAVVGVGGTLCGVALASLLGPLVVAGLQVPLEVPVAIEWSLSVRHIGVVALVVLTLAAGAGVVAARDVLRASARAVHGRSGIASAQPMRLTPAMGVLQLGLTVALVALSCGALKQWQTMHSISTGVNADGVVALPVTRAADDGAPGADRVLQLLESLMARPEVMSAAASTHLPYALPATALAVDIRPQRSTELTAVHVTAHWFDTVGTPLVMGRAHAAGNAMECVAESGFAQKTAVAVGMRTDDCTVVGIAHDVPLRLAGANRSAITYRDWGALAPSASRIWIVAKAQPGQLPALMRAIESDAGHHFEEAAVGRVRTLESHVSAFRWHLRLAAWLMGLLASTALVIVLVSVGMAVAHSGLARRREHAIRMAVGATPGRVVAEEWRRAARTLVPGVVLGIPLAVVVLQTLPLFTLPADAGLLPLVGAAGAITLLSASLAAWLVAIPVGRRPAAAVLQEP